MQKTNGYALSTKKLEFIFEGVTELFNFVIESRDSKMSLSDALMFEMLSLPANIFKM